MSASRGAGSERLARRQHLGPQELFYAQDRYDPENFVPAAVDDPARIGGDLPVRQIIKDQRAHLRKLHKLFHQAFDVGGDLIGGVWIIEGDVVQDVSELTLGPPGEAKRYLRHFFSPALTSAQLT